MTEASINKLIEEINKKYTPEGSVLPIVSKSKERPTQKFIPCMSPALSFCLGTGGWPVGHLTEFFGKEHAGKTTLMMLALKDAFEYYDGKRPIAYIDIEHRYNDEWAKLLGLPGDMILIQPENAEQATDIMQTLIKPKTGDGVCAIGFDSIGGASVSDEFQKFGDKEFVVGRAAAVMSRNVKTMAPLANLNACTVFYSNQLRADFSGYNRPLTPGGHAVKHMMSMRVYLWPSTKNDTKKLDKIDGQDVQVGFEMNFRIVKNTFGPPHRDGKSTFYFRSSRLYDGIGFDIEADIQNLGMLTGLISRAGSVYSYGDVKGQGRDAFFIKIKAEGLYDQLLKDINSHLTERFALSMFKDDDDRGEHFVDINDPEV